MARDQVERARRAGVLTEYTDLHGQTVHASDEALAAVLAALGEQPPPAAPPWPPALPTAAWAPEQPRRDWGLFLPHHALQSASTRGLGDLTALGRLGRWAGAQGASLLGTLPLLPTFLHSGAGPYEPSPYAPVSRHFWGEHLLDPTATPQWPHCPTAQDLLAQARADGTLERLRAGEHIEPAAAWELQWSLLTALSKVFWQDPDSASTIAEWTRHGGVPGSRLWAYARFRAASQTHGPWPTWTGPERFDGTTPERPLDQVHEQVLPAVDEEDVRTWVYAQWEARRQLLHLRDDLSEHGVQLYLDLPIGTHPDGFDTFMGTGTAPLHVSGVSAGAPPDPYFTSGQDWGFPPVHPRVSEDSGHEDLRVALDHHASVAGRLRIDHILGFYRMFWVPASLGAARGVYVRYPAQAWWQVLIDVSHQAQCHMIGENLGMVPPALTEAMGEHEVNGMHVAQFSLQGDVNHPLRWPDPGDLTCLNTHDTPTFAGWWTQEDLDTQAALGWLNGEREAHERGGRSWLIDQLRPLAQTGPLAGTDAPEAQRVAAALVVNLARSEAGTVLLNLEDLWGETRAHNVPGTWRELPNWLRRASRSLEQLDDDPHIQAVLAAMRDERPRSSP